MIMSLGLAVEEFDSVVRRVGWYAMGVIVIRRSFEPVYSFTLCKCAPRAPGREMREAFLGDQQSLVEVRSQAIGRWGPGMTLTVRLSIKKEDYNGTRERLERGQSKRQLLLALMEYLVVPLNSLEFVWR
jgi:hypothetical protein